MSSIQTQQGREGDEGMHYWKPLIVGKMFLARKQKSPQLSSITSASNRSGKYPGEGKDIPQLIQGSFVSLLAAFL